MNLENIAKDLVKKSMLIGQKPNPGINLARKKFGKAVEKILKMEQFTAKELKQNEKNIIEKLKDPVYGPLIIEKNGKYQAKTKVGECVKLVYSDVDPECIKLAKLIKEECWKQGAHVVFLTYSSAESRKHLQLIPDETATELPLVSKLMAEACDARIFLGGDEDLNWIRGLEYKQKLGAPVSQKLHEIMDRKKTRWCLFGWPVPRKQYFVNKYDYRRIFLQSIEQTFTPKVKQLCNYYKKALANGNVIKITADDGTDLTFGIKGRPILVADGIIDQEDVAKGDVGLNIPDGEVFVAPLEHSANGYILFDYVCIHGFGLVKNLEIKFKNGKVIWFNADMEGKKLFKKFLDSNTGEKDRIGELGIGTNPAAKFIGETIVDEKIFGSIHIAIGSNTGAYHGKNRSSSHQDMIKIMKGKNGKLFVDDKLVMDNGLPGE
ncbi:MAG: aminopeptidase [Euryarchaeota archaeon]|nr:aminopeptidase [Euryarchaeota archaeon]